MAVAQRLASPGEVVFVELSHAGPEQAMDGAVATLRRLEALLRPLLRPVAA